VLELGLQNQVRPITKRRCLRRRPIPRFLHQLPLPRTPRQRLSPNRRCLCPMLAARARLQPRADRRLPTSPPYRRLESLTYGTILPGFEWLPWLSRRASQAVLFA